jgi:hypothetical protein
MRVVLELSYRDAGIEVVWICMTISHWSSATATD